MKRMKVLVTSSILLAMMALGGCRRLPIPVTDHTEGTEQEEGFEEVLPLTKGDVDYYRSFQGSSSVYTEYAIYQYEDSFIFLVNYFNCGEISMETFALTEDQTEAFIEELNQCCKAGGPDEEKEIGDGGWTAECEVSVNGRVYFVDDISLTELGISLEEDPDMQEETAEELSAYEEGNLGELREATEAYPFFLMNNGTLAQSGYYHMIQAQIEERMGVTVTRATVVEKRDFDYVLELETDQGETWKATVTYPGYVVEIQ